MLLLKWTSKVLHQRRFRIVEAYFGRFPGITTKVSVLDSCAAYSNARDKHQD